MKPIDDPRFADAVRLFEQEYSIRTKPGYSPKRALALHMQGFAAKPSPKTHYRTMSKLREQVFNRLDAARTPID